MSVRPVTGCPHLTVNDLRDQVVGVDVTVPLLGGGEGPYVYLDNAASTPAFQSVAGCVNEFLIWYSGVHRGTGFKSQLATEAFDRAHELIARFVGADSDTNAVVFTKNTTEAINKLANRFPFEPGDVVITTLMEHHSNDLPWRRVARTVHVEVDPVGRIDLEQLQHAISEHAGRLRLVAVSGASNVTGVCPPIHDIAEWAHAAGAKIVVDAAQLAPHRPIDMLADDDPRHLDFLAASGHKMYAPFGSGILIGPISFFAEGDPDMVGGGVVEAVTLSDIAWSEPPHKDEAGSQNIVGAIAMAAATAVLRTVGVEAIVAHERRLLAYALEKLGAIEGVTLYGPHDDVDDRVGVISFNVEGMDHALVAAIAGAEHGIGVRNGCFCAHGYVKHLLGVGPGEETALVERVRAGDKSEMPGMVRASLGCYSNEADVDALATALERIARREYEGDYLLDPESGSYRAAGYEPRYEEYFPACGLLAPLPPVTRDRRA